MSKAQELAAEVEGLERSKHKRRRYPSELRRRIVEHVRERRAAGMLLNDIAREIGISSTLLHRWDLTLVRKFRRVELSAAPSSSARCLLHAPHGVRVEGLTLDDLVEVLRRLG
jgi:transposase-like protein